MTQETNKRARDDGAIDAGMETLRRSMKALERMKRGRGAKKVTGLVEPGSSRESLPRKPLLKMKIQTHSKRSKKTNIKLTSKCPKCPKEYKSAWSVRRHLMDSHEVKKEDLGEYKLDTTQRRCRFCKEMMGNVNKHEKKHCKLRFVEREIQEGNTNQSIPEAFISE